jgi:uncharacterized membrane protein HdeD (DUF308 family)
MDDESIINEDGKAFNGNWWPVCIAVAICIIGGVITLYELVAHAISAVF